MYKYIALLILGCFLIGSYIQYKSCFSREPFTNNFICDQEVAAYKDGTYKDMIKYAYYNVPCGINSDTMHKVYRCRDDNVHFRTIPGLDVTVDNVKQDYNMGWDSVEPYWKNWNK